MSKLLTKLSFAVLILGIIGSIALFFSLKSSPLNGIGTAIGYSVAGLIGSVILFAILNSLSIILDTLDDQNKKLLEITGMLDKMKKGSEK